jgi:prolipoprotein diacylglyceryltransferase
VIEIAGRFGCLAAGCCTGTICGRWALIPICAHGGRDSEVFARQLTQGLVDVSAEAALPTHPLPVYFMLAAVALLALLLWQLRRRAAPGTLMLTFSIVWPVSKLALEQLRETPRPPGLATAVPVAMLVASAIVMALGLLRSGPPAQRSVIAAGRPDPG